MIQVYFHFSYNGDVWNQSPSKTHRKHAYARIANYLEQPFIVGGSDNGNTITERLSSLGIWEQENKWPFSNRIFNYATVSRKLNDPSSDYVLIIGGQTGEEGEQAQSDRIAKFAAGLTKWTIVGHLQHPRHSHSAIQNAKNQILVVGGDDLRYSEQPKFISIKIFRDTEQLFLDDDGYKYQSYLGSPRLYNFRLWPLLIHVNDLGYCWFP